MINNKIRILICIVVLIVLIISIRNQLTISKEGKKNTEDLTVSNIMYDENTSEYYITDKETGEVLHTADSEDDLYIYTVDPDYDSRLQVEDTDEFLQEENLEY